ncbi:MAG: hypothetical protein IBX45_03385 [Campylobacterales bacterium]|nr:hypothetical protein [Campylobacterales bacterium]
MVKVIFGCFLGILLLGCAPKEPVPSPTPPQEKTPPRAAYPHCATHKEKATHAYAYVVEEFEAAYLSKKDIHGANAQLFLITTRAQTSFAQNMNAAQETYNNHYALAKENGCDLTAFPSSPLDAVRTKIKTLTP